MNEAGDPQESGGRAPPASPPTALPAGAQLDPTQGAVPTTREPLRAAHFSPAKEFQTSLWRVEMIPQTSDKNAGKIRGHKGGRRRVRPAAARRAHPGTSGAKWQARALPQGAWAWAHGWRAALAVGLDAGGPPNSSAQRACPQAAGPSPAPDMEGDTLSPGLPAKTCIPAPPHRLPPATPQPPGDPDKHNAGRRHPSPASHRGCLWKPIPAGPQALRAAWRRRRWPAQFPPPP